jgi:small subunit ribosomal protein S6e
MVEFVAVVSDPKGGKSFQSKVAGHLANSLVGKKVGDEIDGIFVQLPGYKLKITGGSDRAGFPMIADLPGTRYRRILTSEGPGYHATTRHKKKRDKPTHEAGLRKKKPVRGNTISPETSQVNLKITTRGAKPIEDLLKAEAKKADEKAPEKK